MAASRHYCELVMSAWYCSHRLRTLCRQTSKSSYNDHQYAVGLYGTSTPQRPHTTRQTTSTRSPRAEKRVTRLICLQERHGDMLTLTTKQLEIVGTHQFCEAVFSSSTAAAVTVKDICYSIGMTFRLHFS